MVPLPQVLKLASRYDAKRHVAVLSGSITAAGVPRPHVIVHLWSFSDARFTHGSVFGSTLTKRSVPPRAHSRRSARRRTRFRRYS
jgi:hypothetical protein